MGRPKKTAAELRASGARAGRIRARLLEEAPARIAIEPVAERTTPDALTAYLAAVKRENTTFSRRCVAGEVLSREYGMPCDWPDAGAGYQKHGAIFNWHPGLLTRCRDYAQEVANDPTKPGTWALELSTRFLKDLSAQSEFVLDVEASKNVERMLKVFADPAKPIPLLRLLAMIEFLCWKRRNNGEFRFPDEGLLDFHPEDIETMDAAFKAQQAAAEI